MSAPASNKPTKKDEARFAINSWMDSRERLAEHDPDVLQSALAEIRKAVDEAEHELMTERHGQKQGEDQEGETEAPAEG